MPLWKVVVLRQEVISVLIEDAQVTNSGHLSNSFTLQLSILWHQQMPSNVQREMTLTLHPIQEWFHQHLHPVSVTRRLPAQYPLLCLLRRKSLPRPVEPRRDTRRE